jgi:uncharacterized protein YdaU (DUF1376 family)
VPGTCRFLRHLHSKGAIFCGAGVSEFPYFPLYPTDLLGDDKVILQNLTEFGAYVRLLCLAWQQTPPATIPSDDAMIARMLAVTPSVWAGLKPMVIQCWQLRGDRYYNKRLGAVFGELTASRHKRRVAGSLGGKQCYSNATAMLQHTGGGGGGGGGNGSTPEPYSSAFLSFWDAYPRKVGKSKAWATWRKTNPPLDRILPSLVWQIKSTQWCKEDGQFIPHPVTYLNQGRWEDEATKPIEQKSYI